MAGLVQYLTDGYFYVFEELHHPLSKGWFLVGHPYKIISLLIVYNFFCLKLGPQLMKNRQPFELRNTIKIYNIFQIIISFYLFYKAGMYIFSKEFNPCCAGLDDPNSERAASIVPDVQIFYLVKIMDLLDTVFFVLRKSYRQITSLHMHHHTLMPMSAWLAVTFLPGGQSIIIGFINSFVHAIMYFYYLLAGLGDKYKQSLWWKKYLTMLQLVQFMIIGVQAIISLFYTCNFPTPFRMLIVLYGVVFLNMFGQFYHQNYVVKKDKSSINSQNGVHTARKEKSL